MRLSDLHYELPAELIAQRPVEPRDASRLLVLDRASGHIAHRRFCDIEEYLRPGDHLVLNNTRVIPARFFCRRLTGGRTEALFLHASGALWHVLFNPAGRLRPGEILTCEGSDRRLLLVDRHERGEWTVRPEPPVDPFELLQRVGQTPLPPYIRRPSGPDARDAERYQTVYARRPGAVAAPTAGLHFTPALLQRLQEAGIGRSEVTLHVGRGTFAPIDADELSSHRMHAEWFEVDTPTLETLHAARAAGGNLVAVGTTSVRVLESLACQLGSSDRPESESPPSGKAAAPAAPRLTDRQLPPAACAGWTDLFIYPPYRFRNVDRLVTNFHLPGSTLLALVMAFAGAELIRHAYAVAIEQRYRFYSYGDAMLIL